ncbi:MAG: endonuclease domain-containing protein [Alphaproteobacteria bacterium]|nr:endonuclease domain-containing protein [Alphaproteobacteria bacterium]
MSVAIARKLRSHPTDAESRLWARLRRNQIDGFRFRRQVPLGPYVADFVCFEARLVIEVDGGQHSEMTTDATRTAWLEARRFQVMRFWNNDVLGNLDGVVQTIRDALLAPPSLPSPARGEGEER